MKAIITRFYGPSATRGSRIVARTDAEIPRLSGISRFVFPYDHAMSTDQNHAAAAGALLVKLGIHHKRLISAELPGPRCERVHIVTSLGQTPPQTVKPEVYNKPK